MSSGIFNNQTGYHNRKSIRLPAYNYSQPGYYFITICIHDRKQQMFGNVIDGKMELNEFGDIVQNEIVRTEQIRPNIKIDEYAIMPNHVHIIIKIHDPRIDGSRGIDGSRRGTLQRALLNNDETHIPIQSPPNMGTDPAMMHHSRMLHPQQGTLQRAPTVPQNHETCNSHSNYKFEQFGKPTSNSIPTIVRLTKSTITKQINLVRNTPANPVWQRNYYECIIRNEKALFFILKYIRENPLKWQSDSERHIDQEIQEFELAERDDVS